MKYINNTGGLIQDFRQMDRHALSGVLKKTYHVTHRSSHGHNARPGCYWMTYTSRTFFCTSRTLFFIIREVHGNNIRVLQSTTSGACTVANVRHMQSTHNVRPVHNLWSGTCKSSITSSWCNFYDPARVEKILSVYCNLSYPGGVI